MEDPCNKQELSYDHIYTDATEMEKHDMIECWKYPAVIPSLS